METWKAPAARTESALCQLYRHFRSLTQWRNYNFCTPGNIRYGPQWRRSRGGARGRLSPAPIKIYLGESVFSPPQSFSLCISYTPGTTLRGQKDTQNESRGDGDSETVDERDM